MRFCCWIYLLSCPTEGWFQDIIHSLMMLLNLSRGMCRGRVLLSCFTFVGTTAPVETSDFSLQANGITECIGWT